MVIPSDGHWYVAIDLGGYSGTIKSQVTVTPPPRGNLPTFNPGQGVTPTVPVGQSNTNATTSNAVAASRPSLNSIQHSGSEALPPSDAIGGRNRDVFISHASEDKESVARPLAEALRNLDIEVWLDEIELKIGNSLRRRIDQGIRSSKFAVVVFSSKFFIKGWTQYELDGIVMRTVSGEQNLLPIWHNITKDDMMKYSPSMTDKVARNTAIDTIDDIASEIASVIRDPETE
jgi:hypothetical protein